MRREHRLSLLVLPLIGAGCGLPSRDNPADPTSRPTFAISLIANGTEAFSVTRSGGPFQVRISMEDPRDLPRTVVVTDSSCSGEREIGEIVVQEGVASFIAWAPPSFADLCFTESGGRFGQIFDLRVVEKGNAATEAVARIELANAPPITNPGGTLWVDPTWGTIVPFDNSRHSDPDKRAPSPSDEPLTFRWHQLSGPFPVADFETGLVTYPLEISNPADPATYRSARYSFEVTACDPWECGAAERLDVRFSPASWVATRDGLVMLDSTYDAAQSFANAGGVTAAVSPSSAVGSARDGFWVFTFNSTAAYRIGPDFLRVPMTLPGNFQFLLGSHRASGTSWLRTGSASPYTVTQLSPAGTTTLATGLAAEFTGRLEAVSMDDAGNIWLGAYTLTNGARFQFVRIAGGIATPFVFASGTAEYSCLGSSDVGSALAMPDGSAWFVTDLGAIHLGIDGSTIACHALDDPGADEIRSSLLWTPGADGTGEVLYVYSDDQGLGLLNNGVRRLTDAGGDAVALSVPVEKGAIHFDSSRNLVHVLTRDELISYSPGNFANPVFATPIDEAIPGATGDLFFETNTLVVDGDGRTWLLNSRSGLVTVVLFPEGGQFVRAYHRAGTVIAPNDEDQATVDPATGRIWVAEPDGASGVIAAAYDELGPVLSPDGAGPWRVPLPAGSVTTGGQVGAPDPSLKVIRFDPGSGTRAAGFWIQVTRQLSEVAFLRVALDGSVVASFGEGTGNVPLLPLGASSIHTLYGLPSVLDPVDGSLLVSIHDTDVDPARLGELYRFHIDGTADRFSNVATTLGPAASPTLLAAATRVPSGIIAPTATGIVRVTGAATAFPACLAGDEPLGTFRDLPAGEIAVTCYDPDNSFAASEFYLERYRASTLVFRARAALAPPIAFGLLFSPPIGRVDPMTGSWWIATGFDIRRVDRGGQEVAPQKLPARIEFPIRN